MNEDLAARLKVLEDIADDPPRSELEPYRDLILRWRRKGKTYRRIAELLHAKCGVTVAYSPLYRFVQRRSRPRKIKDETGAPLDKADKAAPAPAQKRSAQEYSCDEIAAMREAARIARQSPLEIVTSPRKLFIYDPNKPITKE